jgi:hypothetical protein
LGEPANSPDCLFASSRQNDITIVGTEEAVRRIDGMACLHPPPQDILAFKVSGATQARIRFLLDKSREETLRVTEMAELDVYEQLEHLIILLKAKAHNFPSRQ